MSRYVCLGIQDGSTLTVYTTVDPFHPRWVVGSRVTNDVIDIACISFYPPCMCTRCHEIQNEFQTKVGMIQALTTGPI